MTVDGTLTEGRWPEHPPWVYRTGKQTFFLDDQYSGEGDFVWDGAAKKITPVGDCSIQRVPGVGAVVVRRFEAPKPAVEVLDFPGDSAMPRVLWRGDGATLGALGVWDDAIVFMRDGNRVLFLEPGRPAREIDFDLGKSRWQPTGKGIRRGKALLLGELPWDARPLTDYTVPVAVIDLKTRQIKVIGEVPGGWLTAFNGIQPRVSVSWITREEAAKLPKRPPFESKLGSFAYVIEGTDEIVRSSRPFLLNLQKAPGGSASSAPRG